MFWLEAQDDGPSGNRMLSGLCLIWASLSYSFHTISLLPLSFAHDGSNPNSCWEWGQATTQRGHALFHSSRMDLRAGQERGVVWSVRLQTMWIYWPNSIGWEPLWPGRCSIHGLTALCPGSGAGVLGVQHLATKSHIDPCAKAGCSDFVPGEGWKWPFSPRRRPTPDNCRP